MKYGGKSNDHSERKPLLVNGKCSSNHKTQQSLMQESLGYDEFLPRRKNYPVQNSNANCSKEENNYLNEEKLSSRLATQFRANYGGTSEIEEECVAALASCNSIEKNTIFDDQNKLIDKTNSENSHYITKNLKQSKRENINSNNDFNYSIDRQGGSDEESNYQTNSNLDHCHDCSDEKVMREKKKRKTAMKKLIIATVLSFLFMVGEITGGYLASSLAIMTDASHLLTDVSSFIISIVAIQLATRPISKSMTFGWYRAEVIGALLSVLAIWVVTGILIYLAILRIVDDNYEIKGQDMLITAGVSVGFNIIMVLVLHDHGGHSHHHNHNHDHNHESGNSPTHSESNSRHSEQVNVRAAFIHVLGDLLQSVGVLTAAFIIYFKPEYKIADPICTFLFSFFVLITTVTVLRDTTRVIMEASPLNVEYNDVKEKLLEIEEIIAVHDLRLWSLTLNQTVVSAHLVINRDAISNLVLRKATQKLKDLHQFHSLTLQIEYYSDEMQFCNECNPA